MCGGVWGGFFGVVIILGCVWGVFLCVLLGVFLVVIVCGVLIWGFFCFFGAWVLLLLSGVCCWVCCVGGGGLWFFVWVWFGFVFNFENKLFLDYTGYCQVKLRGLAFLQVQTGLLALEETVNSFF